MANSSIQISDLPDRFQKYADVIGGEAAIRMFEYFRGANVVIPKHPATHKKGNSNAFRRTILVKVIGLKCALRLSEVHGGEVFYSPNRTKLETKTLDARNKKIIQMYDDGASPREIADRFNLSHRHIWSILCSPSPV